MHTLYSCGCAISREEFGVPANWPMLFFCPLHGAPKVDTGESAAAESAADVEVKRQERGRAA